MDHGLLNLPLARRGNIDAQIDRYKAAELAASNTARLARNQARKAAKARAVALLGDVEEGLLARLAARAGLSVAGMRKRLVSDCHWQPDAVIALLAE